MKKFLFLIIFVLLISCGKKGDPVFKESNHFWNAGIFFVTTAPAPTNAYSPIVFPQIMVAFAPIDAPFFIKVCKIFPLRLSCVPSYFVFFRHLNIAHH